MMLIAACLLLAAANAGAQTATVWRCGTDGRDYREAPCAEGRAVAVADPRSAEQVDDARQVAAQERALAERLAAERRARERESRAEGGGLAGFRTTPPLLRPQEALAKRSSKRQAHSKPKRPKTADDGTWRAAGPSSRRDRG